MLSSNLCLLFVSILPPCLLIYCSQIERLRHLRVVWTPICNFPSNKIITRSVVSIGHKSIKSIFQISNIIALSIQTNIYTVEHYDPTASNGLKQKERETTTAVRSTHLHPYFPPLYNYSFTPFSNQIITSLLPHSL